MTRPSIALFLATAGLVAGTVGCGRTPEPMEGGEAGDGTPEMSAPAAGQMEGSGEKKMKEGDEGGEGGEGGEG